MRVDKYLWCIRVFKTRSLATEWCREGKVSILGEAIKAARELKGGEKITVRKGAIHFVYEVKDFPKSRVAAKLVPDYAIDMTPKEELDKLEMILLAKSEDRWKGLGRPTKKDRRDIDKFFE